MRLSLEQLRSRTWPTREGAEKDLKKAGLPKQGEDYVLGQADGGSWMILDRTDQGADDVAPDAKEAMREALKRSGPAKAAQKKAAPQKKAGGFGERIVGGNANPPRKERGKKAAAKKPVPEAEPTEADEQPAEAEGSNDMSQLPDTGQEYCILIDWPRFSILTGALTIGRSVEGGPLTAIHIVGQKDHKVYRTLDCRLGGKPSRGKRASVTRTPREGGTAPAKAARTEPSAMQKQLIELAVRPAGVTRGEIAKEVSDRKLAWTTMLKECERFGYTYRSTDDAAAGRGGRTVYYLTKKA